MGDRERGRDVFEQVQTDARVRLLLEPEQTSNLYVQREVLSPGTRLDVKLQPIEVDRDTIMVFSDDAPQLNWGHPCRYLLYGAEEGQLYRTVEAQFPPYLVREPETFQPFHQPVVFARPELKWSIRDLPELIRPRPSNWFAVLYSGASNNRHTNDLEFLYRTLRHVHGVAADRIYVLNYDGTIDYSGGPHPVTTWPGDDTPYEMTVNAAGTKAELENVIDELKGRLTESDCLLIHTNNHGGHNGESFLVTESGPDYGVSDFADKIAELPSFDCLMVMMEQCFAGGFNAPIIAGSPAHKTNVASAAIEANTSIGGPEFDPFARDWIAAMHWADPDGSPFSADTDHDGHVSALEAFTYADSVHHPHDTPNYSESSVEAGSCNLGGYKFPWIIPDIYLVLERYWEGPIPEGLARIQKALPELEKITLDAAERFQDIRHTVEERIAELLR
ncbi:MAG TPA: hypothetical protein VGB51_11180 [Actinomycetota bacterium]